MVVPPVLAAAVPLAVVERQGTVESVHLGTVAVHHPNGTVTGRGDPDVVFLPRSALKPVQAVAMLRAGLDLDGELLALACASHSGEPGHVDGVRRILAGAGLDETDLDNTPDLPLGAAAAADARAAGTSPSPVLQNCSGKHAGMLAACVAAGWPTAGYRDPAHPLQRLVRDTVAELTGVCRSGSPPSTAAARRCSAAPRPGWPGPSRRWRRPPRTRSRGGWGPRSARTRGGSAARTGR